MDSTPDRALLPGRPMRTIVCQHTVRRNIGDWLGHASPRERAGAKQAFIWNETGRTHYRRGRPSERHRRRHSGAGAGGRGGLGSTGEIEKTAGPAQSWLAADREDTARVPTAWAPVMVAEGGEASEIAGLGASGAQLILADR